MLHYQGTIKHQRDNIVKNHCLGKKEYLTLKGAAVKILRRKEYGASKRVKQLLESL